MNLNILIQNLEPVLISGETNIEINSIQFDSRMVGTQDIFVAIKGYVTDGHQYIPQVIESGVSAVVCEQVPSEPSPDITFIQVDSSQKALAIMAKNFYGNPASKLRLVGVTGTNGKTTIATLLFRLVKSLGYKAGLISTIVNHIDDRIVKATHTTPDVLSVNKLLAEMVDSGCEFCFMEVSSHAIDQRRIEGLSFEIALFTNITHDHLDYHKTFKDYLYTKKRFFDELPSGAIAITNADDKNGEIILQNTKAKKVSFALKNMASHKARILEQHFDGMLMTLDDHEIWVQLTGAFNASNILAIYTAALYLNFSTDEILPVLSSLQAAPGRFEIIKAQSGIIGIVDYAHTPDAVENVLRTTSQINNSKGRIFCVLGAGGNRDKEKRPIMAKIASKYAYLLILTSDNPRFEEPEAIIREMKSGIGADECKTISISDRREAIRTACTLAEKNDIVLVCGKGHETYQEVKGVRHHFDDREEIRKIFNKE